MNTKLAKRVRRQYSLLAMLLAAVGIFGLYMDLGFQCKTTAFGCGRGGFGLCTGVNRGQTYSFKTDAHGPTLEYAIVPLIKTYFWGKVYIVPCWPFVVFFVWRARMANRVLMRLQSEDVCNECGYDLTGNTSGRCPECGIAKESTEGPPCHDDHHPEAIDL
jgi:hypothetical protein